MANTRFVAGNWKMNKTVEETQSFLTEAKSFKLPSNCRAIVAPSPTLLPSALQAAQGGPIEVFSQNCHWENEGAYTGEISPAQLKDLGVKGTLVGHSERRQYFAETNESCLKRILKALESDLEVIYCVGEPLEVREAGNTKKLLAQQLKEVLATMSDHPKREKLTIAYEPVWAIGTGKTATPEQIAQTHADIHEMLKEANLADCSILYGGSVKPENFAEISSLEHVDGGLVGGASLKTSSFQALLDCLT